LHQEKSSRKGEGKIKAEKPLESIEVQAQRRHRMAVREDDLLDSFLTNTNTNNMKYFAN